MTAEGAPEIPANVYITKTDGKYLNADFTSPAATFVEK